ncbi:MAG TPA: inositol-3-phosphate synthase, partial [Desulfosarcina sp.]|nr:inositol-3-phosphate synthase [Desulfosarcina sp.]
PDPSSPLTDQVERLRADIRSCRKRFPQARPVLVNLLPAACDPVDPERYAGMDQLLGDSKGGLLPDLAYVAAALDAGVPVVNFTPNTVELPAIRDLAQARGVPLAGRDGKTGQTYFKVVLASALKARGLYVDGWYSLNILGNADGLNLMDPERACGKLNNKTRLLDDILGYPVGQRYGRSTHKVHIDYYPPRGDAKEAWDVVDITGIFGMSMSLRLNLQGRDSILAAPMALDLARWAAALHCAGIAGPIADLGFYFKKPVGDNPPLTFEDQLAALARLESRIEATIAEKTHGKA